MPENNSIYNIIVNVLGKPKKYNETQQQGQWDCIGDCLIENGDVPDGKGNLEISFSKNLFHCWKCDYSGALRKLVKKYGSKFDLKRFDTFSNDFNDDNQNNKQHHKELICLPKELILFKDVINKKDLSYKEAYNYLIFRGLNDEIINEYNIGYCSKGKYENRIIFPSYNKHNKLNYFLARSYVGHKIKYKNPILPKMNVIINEININWDNTIYLVEGVFDMIGLFPIKNIIPLLGKNLNEYLYYILLKKSKGYIIVCLDGDAKKETYQIYKKLHTTIQLKNKVRIIDLPDNSDLSDIRKDFGKEGIIEILKTNRKLELSDYIENNI